MSTLCSVDDITTVLHPEYLKVAVTSNPNIVQESLKLVSAEIKELLSFRYHVSTLKVSSLIRSIAIVFVGYRIMCGITGVVASEARVDNIWLPLQKEYERMSELLRDIASGKQKLMLPEAENNNNQTASGIISVKSPDCVIDYRGY